MDGVVIYLPLLIAIIGAFVYALGTNAKAAELGRCMFWCGLLAWLMRWPGSLLR